MSSISDIIGSTGVQGGSTAIDRTTEPMGVSLRVTQVIKEHNLSFPEPLQKEIGKKVSSIKDVEQKLKDANDHSFRDKLIGVFLIALGVAIIAGAIVGGIHLGALVIAVPPVGAFDYMAVAMMYGLIAFLFVAPGMGCGGFTTAAGMDLLHRQSELKDKLEPLKEQLKEELTNELEKCKRHPKYRNDQYREGVRVLLEQLDKKRVEAEHLPVSKAPSEVELMPLPD